MSAATPGDHGASAARLGIAVAFAAITMFALLDVVSKVLGARMSVIQILWVRFVLFVPLALALAWRPGSGIAWRSGAPGLQVLRVVVLLVEMWFFLTAFAAIPLADAHAIGATAPLLVTALSVIAAVVTAQNSNAGKDPLIVKATAQQFAWQFTYPNDQTYGELRLPKDRTVKLLLTSNDVIHSFWVPAFGEKSDAVPGIKTSIVVTPTRTGYYPVICTQLCGLGHALMRSEAIVMEQADYDAWYSSADNAAPAAAPVHRRDRSPEGAGGAKASRCSWRVTPACAQMRRAASISGAGPQQKVAMPAHCGTVSRSKDSSNVRTLVACGFRTGGVRPSSGDAGV